MTGRVFLTALLACAASGALWAQSAQRPPQRDARVSAVTPAEISGRVMTDQDSPQPVRRAEVRAIPSGGEPRTAFTDAGGRFVFAALPLGSYTIEVTKPGFVRTAFGARRYDRPGTPVILSDTQRTQAIELRMPRGSVITGRIVDEFGQPSQGARVRAQAVRMVNGVRTLSEVPMAGSLFGEAADDRGVYRLYGLPAGEYVISATPRNTGWGDIRQMTEADIRAAEQAVKQPSSAPEAVEPPVTLGYTAVFYPGVTNASLAGGIALKTGEERTGVDIAVRFVRTASIEGTVVASGSVPLEEMELFMLPRQTGGGGLATVVMSGNNRRVGPDGRFSFSGVTPGSYTISARINEQTALWASADVDVDGQNVSGVTLALQEGLTISGQMVFEMDGVDPPTLLTRARVNLIPADGSVRIGLGGNNTEVTQSGAVRLKGVIPGRYRVMANFNTPEARWILKSAVIKGKDATDVAFDLEAGDTITDAVFTFTNRTQALTGTLQDASRRPAPDYTVVVFPTDKALWSSTRRISSTRPGTDGRFSFAGLPAGTYRIAAAADIGPEDLRDPALLEELAAASITFTLAAGEKKVQDLRIASGG